MGTTLSDMRGNYTSVYLRKKFQVEEPSAIGALSLGVLYDDGTRFRIPSWTTANVYLERRFNGLGNFLDGSRIRLTVRNVADRDPPISGTAIGFYSSVHNVLGRGYYLTVTKSFD